MTGRSRTFLLAVTILAGVLALTVGAALFIPYWAELDLELVAGIALFASVVGVFSLGYLLGRWYRNRESTEAECIDELRLANQELRMQVLAEGQKVASILQQELTVDSAVAELSEVLVQHDVDLSEVSSTLLRVALGLTGSKEGYVMEVDPGTSRAVVAASFGGPRQVGGDAWDAGFFCSTCARDPEDASAGGKWDAFFFNTAAEECQAGRPDYNRIERCLSAPALVDGQRSGQIFLANASKDYSKDDLRGVGHLAQLYALAIDRERYEDELREGMLVAEEASRAKSQFLANMSHEIRTPLTVILGMSALALESAEDPELREYLETVQSSSEHLRTIVEDILDMSRIEAGKVELEEAAFAINESLARLMMDFSSATAAKGVELEHVMDPRIPSAVVGDRARLRQVISNLVSNAIKFTENGVIRILVVVKELAEDVVWVRFSVSDTGFGIPADRQRQIFEPFVQADASTTRKHGGSGLGLAICRQLVRTMGGEISLESRPGEGSVFSFVLPFGLAGSQGTQGATTSIERSYPKVPGAPARLLRILVAEDHPINSKLIVLLIEKQGHEVVLVRNGKEAIEALEQPFDLVFMDVQMPEMDGVQATRAIRERDGSSEGRVPIIALTAHASVADQKRCLAAGMDGYLTKPLQPHALFEVIEGVAAGPSLREKPID